jgi:EpsI family protein
MAKSNMSTSDRSKSKWFGPARIGLFAAACLILVFQASASRMLKIDEQKIGIPGLHDIPWQVGPWKASAEQSIGPEVTAYLKPDEYILRDYVDDQPGGGTIDLFVAYFKSLQNVYGPHSPRICLPGSGWLVSSSKTVNIPVPGRPGGIPANQFTMEKSNQRILVLYWYQNDRDVWAEEYHAKLRLLPDLIRYRRSDVSLVRLIAPISGASPDKELASCAQFTERVFPLLAAHFASVH